MFYIQEIVYIAALASVLYMVFRIERRLADITQWLGSYRLMHDRTLVRSDRLISVIADFASDVKTTKNRNVSKELFDETLNKTRDEICSIIVRDFTTKNGKLKKSVAVKIFDEIARKASEHKDKGAQNFSK